MDKKSKKLSDKEIPEFRVCMIGAKCTGKTSMLTSLMNQFDAVAKKVGLSFEAEDTYTQDFMVKRLDQLRELFAKCQLQKDSFDPIELEAKETTISRTGRVDEFTFCLYATDTKGKTHKEPVAKIVFRDMPGEHTTTDVARIREEEIQEINKASVLLIAVDSVSLMEGKGKYAESFSQIKRIRNDFAREECTFLMDGKPKLVLFVPMKCEKYYYGQMMDTLTEKVEQHYAQLIDYMQQEKTEGLITVAVTPVLTMGEIVFSHFKTKDGTKEGPVLLKSTETINAEGQWNQDYMRPEKVYYTFRGGIDNRKNAHFSPQFCEQPLLYLLAFINRLDDLYEEAQKQAVQRERQEHPNKSRLKKVGLIGRLLLDAVLIESGIGIPIAVWDLWRLLKPYRKRIKRVCIHLKIDGDGYKVINDPLGIKQKNTST